MVNSSYSPKGWGDEGDDDLGLKEDDDWGGDWNAPSATTKKSTFSTKKPAKKVTLGSKKKKEENGVIIEDIPATMSSLGLNSSFNETQDTDGWGDDWGTPAKTVQSAAQKKAEREAKLKARKLEMEKKRAAKKTNKLGTRKVE